jgi:type IV pilus assembly protein PilC
MSKFSFKARDKDGKEASGYRDASDKYELARFLRNDGLLLLSAEEVMESGAKKGKSLNFSISFSKLLGRVKLTDKIVFSKNLGVMIGAGLPLTRALDALSRESHNEKFKEVITDLIDQVRQGKTFHESLGRHPRVFPPLYVSMVEAGEKSGKLQESLTLIANQMQADYDLIRKVRGAMVYPTVILVAMLIIGIVMLIYVVPTLTVVFKELNVALPPTTQFIIWLSDIFVAQGLWIVLGMIAALAGLVHLARTVAGKNFLDSFIIRMPLIGPLAKKFNAARTSRILSSLISSGVQILDSLDVTSRVVQNHLYGLVLADAKAAIQRGETISSIFLKHEELYPSLLGEMLSVGEETGEMSRMLGEVATFYEAQVTEATRDLSTIVEPLLMIIIGVAVGFFAVSMIMPMYSLTDVIQ